MTTDAAPPDAVATDAVATAAAPPDAVATAAAPPGAIGGLDAASAETFAAAIAPLFEGAPALLTRLAAARPFGSWPALLDAARSIAHAMPESEQIELVDAHPRLGAPPALVSKLSFGEQGYDRDAAASLAADAARERDRLATELARLNRAYEARFGFRYCVFVAGRSRSELLPDMAAALGSARDAELLRAVDAVIDIASDRHRALASSPTTATTTEPAPPLASPSAPD